MIPSPPPEEDYNDKDVAVEDIEAPEVFGVVDENDDDRPLLSSPLSIVNYIPIPRKSARIRHIVKTVLHPFYAISRSSWGVSRPGWQAVTPTFIHRRRSSSAASGPSATAGAVAPTAWLDGFRGVAALLVVLHHFLYTTHTNLVYPYGHEKKHYYILQWPFLRFFVTGGHAQVSIFFVISGFVLSHKPIRLTKKRDFKGLLDTLASSAFRRGIRLFLPAFADAILAVFLTYWGVFEWSDKYMNKFGWHPKHPVIKKTLYLQFKDMLWLWGYLTNIWHWDQFWFDYDRFLWTIPIEFRESILLFGCLLAVCKAREWIRIVIFMGIAAHATWCFRWTVGCFLSGAVIANLALIIQEVTPEISLRSKITEFMRTSRWMKRINAAMWIFGFYLASAPADYVLITPGYRWTARYVPRAYGTANAHRIVQSAGAIMLIFSTSQLVFAQSIFTTRFALYLGKISYAMYLIHGNVHRGLSYWLCAMAWKMTGTQTLTQYNIGAFLGGCVYFAVLFWCSDLVMRWLDVPSTKLARVVEKWCISD